jgi:hypothetical protein
MIKSAHTYLAQYARNKASKQQKTENWYSYIPKTVCEHEGTTVLWNQGVKTEWFWPMGQT